MANQDIHLGETWTVEAQALLGDQVANFVDPVVFTVADATIVNIVETVNPTTVKVKGLALGSTNLTATSNGVTTVVTVNVLTPFDTIRLVWTKSA